MVRGDFLRPLSSLCGWVQTSTLSTSILLSLRVSQNRISSLLEFFKTHPVLKSFKKHSHRREN